MRKEILTPRQVVRPRTPRRRGLREPSSQVFPCA